MYTANIESTLPSTSMSPRNCSAQQFYHIQSKKPICMLIWCFIVWCQKARIFRWCFITWCQSTCIFKWCFQAWSQKTSIFIWCFTACCQKSYISSWCFIAWCQKLFFAGWCQKVYMFTLCFMAWVALKGITAISRNVSICYHVCCRAAHPWQIWLKVSLCRSPASTKQIPCDQSGLWKTAGRCHSQRRAFRMFSK